MFQHRQGDELVTLTEVENAVCLSKSFLVVSVHMGIVFKVHMPDRHFERIFALQTETILDRRIGMVSWWQPLVVSVNINKPLLVSPFRSTLCAYLTMLACKQ